MPDVRLRLACANFHHLLHRQLREFGQQCAQNGNFGYIGS
jgi:hypothetical protein